MRASRWPVGGHRGREAEVRFTLSPGGSQVDALATGGSLGAAGPWWEGSFHLRILG